MKRQMHLNLFIHSRGHHEASWRYPAASPCSLSDIRYYQALAQQAEAGLFDALFLADQLALGDDIAHGPRTALEPITVLPAMLEVFIAEVIPLLQRRGLFRTAYEGETLRAHYGLAEPESQFG